jgi:hypothetical protein
VSTLSPLLNPSGEFVPEDEVEALRRYNRFAADFYVRLYVEFPKLRGQFRFYRDPASDDFWSVCETEKYAFGVQLYTDIEVICLWDAGYHDEIGTWISDSVAYAIKEIDERYL